MSIPTVSLQDLLQAGVHFGHSTRYWNPRTEPYIFTVRDRIHIIDLEQTQQLLREAMLAISKLTGLKKTLLFVGTKRAASTIVENEARRAGMPYVHRRWLGGMLTNYRTLKSTVSRLRDLELLESEGRMARLPRKENLSLMREKEKLQRNIGGVKEMAGLPDALFVIDVNHEKIAVREANKLQIPVIGLTDTNSDPSGVDYVIPGNDDARRSIHLFATAIADACLAGQKTLHDNEGKDQ